MDKDQLQLQESEKETYDRLNGLSQMILDIYKPAMEEKKKEIGLLMEKFSRQIVMSLRQAYGNVTISVPDIGHLSEDKASKDPEVRKMLQDAVMEWVQTIKDTIQQESERKNDSNTAYGQTEYWRQRSAVFNTLYQQLNMPQVKRIITILEQGVDGKENFSIDTYKTEYGKFQKAHAQAKDFVKFLNTLERQFKNITKGELKSIRDTLSSLLNGLKLIWTISRHINQQEKEMEEILEAISNEICDKVREKIQIKTIFRGNPDQAIALIQEGVEVLEEWQRKFRDTQMSLEQSQSVRRWDFQNIKDIFNKPKHMLFILKDVKEACQILKEFTAILGPDLKAVTGEAAMIESVSDRVRGHLHQIEGFQHDAFNSQYHEQWKAKFDTFLNNINSITGETIELITKTFQNQLNSSEGAFELLAKFKNVKTRKAIEEELKNKYENVLRKYIQELDEMETLYNKGKDDPPIPKNMPPKSGQICWSRSIITRIKTPIDKFKTKLEILKQDSGIEATKKYVKLAKHLTEEHEQQIFDTWKKENTKNAIQMLKSHILSSHIISTPNGTEKVYKVNFNPELKVIIREAKFLDRIGKDIPHTITNIALQANDYMRYIDRLNQLLRSYNSALSNLRPVEKKLLERQVGQLDSCMSKGEENHNWFSLSINEYIKSCQKEIDSFKDIKGRVLGHAKNIQQKVLNIENAVIIRPIDFYSKDVMDFNQFAEYFEKHRVKIIAELVTDYLNIGDLYLKNIEETTFKTNHQSSVPMVPYYQYWERRIFNAITKMTINALAINKSLWTKRDKPLIKMNCSYTHPEMQYHPTPDEIHQMLSKFNRNILDSTKKFGRWWDGFCKTFAEHDNPETGEKEILFTFYTEMEKSQIIVSLNLDITNQCQQIIEKFNYHSDGLKTKLQVNKLFDKNEMNKLQKQIDKQQSIVEIEKKIIAFIHLRKTILEYQKNVLNYFILVDYTDVYKITLKRINEWLEVLGKALLDIAQRELKSIVDETREYEDKLKAEMGGIESLKSLLHTIGDIKNMSMEMELRITEVIEQFRILEMYKYDVSEEDKKKVDSIAENWNELTEFADRKDFEVNDYKQQFKKHTETEVECLQDEIKQQYEKFVNEGPGAEHVNLEQGLELLENAKLISKTFNMKREENVTAEKLFDLPISKFPELIKMDEDIKVYDQIYSIYKEHKEQVTNWSITPWARLETKPLEDGSKQFEKQIMQLGKRLKSAESIPPYAKVKTQVTGFRLSLPLIQNLKMPCIQERHWIRIMEETGKDPTELNFKTNITLAKVFDLELQYHSDKVNEICNEAREEEKNEQSIQKIDLAWKQQQFQISDYKKGNVLKGHVIKSPDDIKALLEENILLLTSLGASKFLGAVKARVKQWEHDLNTINDVIEQWLLVQRKWMYLELIFASDDIKSQLPEEAKKFAKTDINYKKIMEQVTKNPNVLYCCVKSEAGRLNELKNIFAELEKCQKSLTSYLESKKMSFPRFYFISDEDLLQILGSSDPRSISPHLMKLFDNCKELAFTKNDKIIAGMSSDESESYEFDAPTKTEGAVEEWMTRVDVEMKKTLHIIAKKAVFYYAKEDRIEWIKGEKEKQLGMIALLGTQIWWTFQIEDVFKRVQGGDKHAMKRELRLENQNLDNLIALVRTEIGSNLRKLVNTLIILDVHARDIVDGFVRDSVRNAKEFAWEQQLRFYWNKIKDDAEIRQCTGILDYSYEYQGLNGRLVITPLTDRCVMTLTTALTFHLGGSPAGPAGTGKTETVKDLAKSLALRCVVTNCGETLDSTAMQGIFSGLIQTGFWGCFDEFNRINVEVLSVVSTQIQTVQAGLKAKKKKINFVQVDMTLIPTIGIFITMNPGYSGRSELPDNLKALFRPVTMVVPELLMICENMLMSEGFTMAKVLAKKMTTLYKLAKEQLSQQYHYDFGLRALKSVLVMAGSLKRAYSDMPEDLVLMRALRDNNMPKFVFEDVPLFKGLIKDLFPGLDPQRVGYEDLKEKIVEYMDVNGYRHSDEDNFADQCNKIIQLYETMLTRHTTMVVGPTGAGKSVIINTLAAAIKEWTDEPVRIDVINAKMVTIHELYGLLDPVSRDWTDGLLSKTFKEANQDQIPGKPEQRWIVYDGDVDAIWVEDMNSVMDDNKILTLANGDRIRLQRHCKMLFEVFDLQYASPATISRCGMVYVDPKNLGYAPYYQRWVRGKVEIYGESIRDSLTDLFSRYVPPAIDRIYDGIFQDEIVEPLQFITPRTNLNLVQQLTTLIDAILPPPEDGQPQIETSDDILKLYLFCMVWSAGGALQQEEREKFSEFLRQTYSTVLPSNSLYDNCFETKGNVGSFDIWEKKVPEYKPIPGGKFSQILIPTVDTYRYSWLMTQIMKLNKPVMFVGDSGTAKTVTVQSGFREFDRDKYIFLNINFSSRTTSMDFQKIMEENLEKRNFKTIGPRSPGKRLVVFVDDLNMPIIDKYGTQQPNALLKFLVQKNQLYRRDGDLELRDVADTQYVGCMTPPSGNNKVDPRVMSLYSVFNMTFPSKDATEKIYTTMLNAHLAEFHEDVKGCVDLITQSTLSLYYSISEQLPRTPIKFHYIFNLRDLGRIYEGLYKAVQEKYMTKASIVRLWRNEAMRVFSDRLVNQQDQDLVNLQLIPNLVQTNFPDVQEEVMKNPVFYGDYALTDPLEDSEDPRLYEDLGDYESVKDKMEKMLEAYNYEVKPMNLVLFNDALEHLTRIHRIIRFPRGCALLVGYGGSGKQSLTRLATFVAGYDVFTIKLTRNYKEEDFREDLRTLYKEVVTKPRTFLFTDSHVASEGFLELINNILTIGMVPALFADDEKEGVAQPLDDEIKRNKLPDTKEFKWPYFIDRCRENLHIVLAMSPAGDTLRVRCRNFPGLVSNTNIDWFFAWPADALAAVATHFLSEIDIDTELRQPITDHIVLIHQSVQQYSIDFENIYKRKNFSTPKNYLDFIESYTIFLQQKRKKIDSNVRRLEGGLQTLAEAQEDTKVLGDELTIQNAKISEKKIVVEQLIADITAQQETAQAQEKVALQTEADLEVKSKQIEIEEKEAEIALQAAIPALEQAQAALANVKGPDIVEVKSMAAPAQAIKDVCAITYYFTQRHQGGEVDWATIKAKMLGDTQLLSSLQNYDISKTKTDQANKAKKKLAQLIKEQGHEGAELQAIILTKSKAAGGLFGWCVATDKYYDIYKDVEPKKKRAAQMKEQKIQSEKKLAEIKASLKALQESLAKLNADMDEKKSELNELEEKSAIMTRKLNAASKLITGLGDEQKRWTSDMHNFQADKINLTGDCLTASSFLSYCGPFNFVLREQMLFKHWKKDLVEKNIPNTETFALEKFLTNDVEVSKWASEGLPSDDLSIQNGILTNFASRFPLCIDPQMQAVSWIKEKELSKNGKDKFSVLTFNQDGFSKKLEMAIQFGASILFENIDEELDPLIDPVLEKNIIVEAGCEIIEMGDSKIDWNPDFRMFLTTKISNPNYSPETFAKTMVINFNVTLLGLRDQLLNEVVGFERPELEAKRKQLVQETAQNRTELSELEDTLLSELSKKTDVPLVDNIPLIEVLEHAKSKSVSISNDLENAKVTSATIEANRESYKDVAKRGAILFFAMTGLHSISEMYEYSLSSYLQVFKNALETSRKDNVLQARLRNIKEKLTQLVYEFTCMGIFERHKLTFSFTMTTMILEGDLDTSKPDAEQNFSKTELDFFLKGNTSLDAVEAKPNKWMLNNGWKDAVALNDLGGKWGSLIESLKDNEKQWKAWFDEETPEKVTIPCGFDAITPFQKLLLCRVLRPDRVVNAIKQFIIASMSEYYVKPPPVKFESIYAQSREKTPIVFILSPGADPSEQIDQLANDLGQNGKLKKCSLGQGMEKVAQSLIENGGMRGHWVLLQNCHLLQSWLKKLEAIIENQTKPDKAFRLWLTTNPTNKFPLGILQKSLKVVTEPPDGLGQNIKASYSRLKEEDHNKSERAEYRSLLYVLTFFHAVIQERKKFGKIGWNVMYDFNDSDYKISTDLIGMYLQKSVETNDEEIPWDTLRYLIGEAMYGGRVTDNYDRRVLNTYLTEYLGDFIFDSNQKFYFSRAQSGDYTIPEELDPEKIMEIIDEIPIFTSPSVFGLHSNAEIQYFTNAAKDLWVHTLSMQTSDGSSAGGGDKDQYINTVATEIQEKLPELFDIPNIKKQYEVPSPTPTQVVLLQELERFNILLDIMHSTLFDLKRALVGEIGMSSALDELGNAIFNGFLPPAWAKWAPSTEKNLVNWMEHFDRRYNQYKSWIEEEEPKVIWLSGFQVPASYLTALVQTTCRAKNWALDKSTLYTEVTKEKSASAIKKKPEHGCFVQGLYIEGAKWSTEKDCLDYQNPKELVMEMPLLRVVPIEANRVKLRGTLKTPVYVTQARKNAMGVGWVFDADLKTDKHDSHWVLQGVCLVLNTD